MLHNIINNISAIHPGLTYHMKNSHIGRLGLIMFNESNDPITNEHLNEIAKLPGFVKFYKKLNYDNPHYLCILFKITYNKKLKHKDQILMDMMDAVGFISPSMYDITLGVNITTVIFTCRFNEDDLQLLYNKFIKNYKKVTFSNIHRKNNTFIFKIALFHM